jgi:tRNA(fMet)-specific endonuclease VapC
VTYLLDTDHLSIADQDTIEGFNLGRRLARVPAESIAVTIVTYEEQMRGWLAYIARARTLAQQVDAYRRLRDFVERFRRIPLVDFDAAAAAEFERLRQARLRIGTMDLRIAAIALANDATLLSRNLSDFGRVPRLRVEDWTL